MSFMDEVMFSAWILLWCWCQKCIRRIWRREMLALVASHIHIPLLCKQQRLWQEDWLTSTPWLFFPCGEVLFLECVVHIKSYSKRYGLHIECTSHTTKSTYSVYTSENMGMQQCAYMKIATYGNEIVCMHDKWQHLLKSQRPYCK